MPRPRSTDAEVRSRPTARGIRAAMGWADLSLQELADATGLPARSISRWRSGATVPRAEALQRIAAATGLPLVVVEGDVERLVAVGEVIDVASAR